MLKKTEIIEIESKPKPPYDELSLVTHPKAQDAIDTYEDRHGSCPKTMYFYNPPSGKFQSWIIPKGTESDQ